MSSVKELCANGQIRHALRRQPTRATSRSIRGSALSKRRRPKKRYEQLLVAWKINCPLSARKAGRWCCFRHVLASVWVCVNMNEAVGEKKGKGFRPATRNLPLASDQRKRGTRVAFAVMMKSEPCGDQR
jgi:hypothetical protein